MNEHFEERHNNVACDALLEYDQECEKRGLVGIPALAIMNEVARRRGVSVLEMKEHWMCVENKLSVAH